MNDGRMVPTSTTPAKARPLRTQEKNKIVRRSEISQALVVHDFTPVFSHPNLQDSLTSGCWVSLVLCLLKKYSFFPPFLSFFFLGFVWGGGWVGILLLCFFRSGVGGLVHRNKAPKEGGRRQEGGGGGGQQVCCGVCGNIFACQHEGVDIGGGIWD
jgi:hypothetical protein